MKKTVRIEYAEVEVSDIYVSEDKTIADFIQMVKNHCTDTIGQMSLVRQRNPDVDMLFVDGELHALLNFIENEIKI